MDGIEIHDERFRRMVLANAKLEKLADGFRWLEGPVWFADMDMLIFSDIPANRVLCWSERSGVAVFRQPSDFANGHARDRQGRLITCSHHRRAVLRTEQDGRITVLADRFEGARLNAPNDAVVKSDGSIWFSDPLYGLQTDYEGGRQRSERPASLFRLDPESGRLTVAADDFEGPNGLCFSPDERLLYVAETGDQFAPHPRRLIRVFDVAADGASLSNGRPFVAIHPGYADGFRCDEHGHIWSGAGDGVHCIAQDGKLLGKIVVPHAVQNLAFGDREHSRLFLCAAHTLFAIFVNVRGAVR